MQLEFSVVGLAIMSVPMKYGQPLYRGLLSVSRLIRRDIRDALSKFIDFVIQRGIINEGVIGWSYIANRSDFDLECGLWSVPPL